ncbi:type VII secretion-associated protein [Gordonia sp. CPCC 205515]|uniref:type VII secretion-associated protein n=1 Tax=Gordonia sp. CPCC 205515 TaxID=3140791 RepID=UPI003AF3CFAD
MITRPTVIDLAYGRMDRDGAAVDVTDLLNAADATTVQLDGVVRHTDHAWRDVWRDLGLPETDEHGPHPVIIGHPSTWGRPRTAVLARSTADLGVPTTVVPRALLIARSHTDLAVQRCAVVETTHRPEPPSDPARPPQTWWDVTRLRRTSAGWEVEDSDILEPDATDLGDRVEEVIADSVEMVLVDGTDPAQNTHAVDVLTTHALAGRVLPVDRAIVRRYGWRTGRPEGSDDHGAPPPVAAPPAPPRRFARYWIPAAGAIAVLIAVVAGVVGFLQRDDDPAEHTQRVAVGRTSLEVPADWRRSELGSGQASSASSRTVFADPATGRRILVVQSQVRADSSLASVATSLNNRIRQRGDDVVTEFSPSTRFMGRDVISYREAPASGSAIRWYVLVEDGLQVSIGCQNGDEGESVDAECATAVESVRIVPGK